VTTTTANGGSDRELLDAVAAGDRHALRALYERHARWLVLRLARRCADPAVVDQAVQDTFLGVAQARHLPGERGGGSLDLGDRGAPPHRPDASPAGAHLGEGPVGDGTAPAESRDGSTRPLG
jgi:hypothetical protein